MKPLMLIMAMGLTSNLAVANAPLNETQMAQYASSVSKTTIGKKYQLNMPLVAQSSNDIGTDASTTIVQQVTHPGASYIKLHFTNLNLANGGKLVVRSQSGNERYEYTHADISAATIDTTAGDDGLKQFSAMSVSDDTVIVEYTPGANKPDKLANIDYYYHGVTGQQAIANLNDTSPLSTCGARSAAMCNAGHSRIPLNLNARVRWQGY